MKIILRQFLGKNHSWAVTGRNLAAGFMNLKHDVSLFSTDGTDHLPDELKKQLTGYSTDGKNVFGSIPSNDYDLAISYTAPINFPGYLSHGKKKFGIWCYEWAGKNVLPNGFAKNYQVCDQILAPTHFAKQVFLDSGVPASKISVIPHGVDKQFIGDSIIKLPTTKNFKLLFNVAQNHKRKNIDGLLEAYGKAFTKNDDVSLIIKGKESKKQFPFEISLNDAINSFRKKYPNHAEIKILSNYIEDISALYRSIDASVTLSFCEGFYYPGLESALSGKLSIAPNWGGQLDFLNSDNALLVAGTEARADPSSMYWESKNNAIWFKSSIDDAVDKLRFAKNNFTTLNQQIEKNRHQMYEKYNWSTVTKQIIDLC